MQDTHDMHDPLPILCRACGGPVTPTEDIHIVCPFCATPDELPREAHARVRELRRRLLARARTLDQLSRVDLALALVFERPAALLKTMTPYGLLALCMLFAMVPTLTDPTAPPHAFASRLGTICDSVGLMLAIPLALLITRRLYAREICGRLRARPPLGPAGRARCRCCAAALPGGYGPLLRCRHCHTYSLVTREHQQEGARALASQEEADRHRRNAVAIRVGLISGKLDRCLYLSFALLYFVGYPLLKALLIALLA